MAAEPESRDIVPRPDAFHFSWQARDLSSEVAAVGSVGIMGGIPIASVRHRRVLDTSDYSNPAAVVDAATFRDIRPENFGLLFPEFRSVPDNGDEAYPDEALRKAHYYLKQRPEVSAFSERWQYEDTAYSQNFAYITILTDDKYLPGVILLHYSVRQAGGEYPFVVLYTPSLSETAVKALKLVQDSKGRADIELHRIDPLLPAAHHKLNLADPRFADTWTKLRVFQFYQKYTTMVYLDADMLVRHADRIDKIFDYGKHLPQYCIAAVHDCTCSNKEYIGQIPYVCKKNCVFHFQKYNDPEKTLIAQPGQKGPITMFNSGMFLFHPSMTMWEAMRYYFDNTPMLAEFRFPDQDFLVNFFKYRWASIPFEWNAVKTMAYRHVDLWDDGQYGGLDDDGRLRILHYIVDKPWAKRTDFSDVVVGFSGQDRVTHAYWWSRFQNFEEQKKQRGEFELLSLVNKYLGNREGKRLIDEE